MFNDAPANTLKTDLLGDNTTKQQAVADATRAKDAKRNTGNDNQDTFTLSGSNSEADIAAANGASPLFSRKDTSTQQDSVSAAVLNAVINRVSAGWKAQANGKAVVVAARWHDLPSAIVAYANKQGYDNSNADDRITSVHYQGNIYLVQENIHSALEAEEALLHERMHQVLQSQDKNALTSAMNRFYFKVGGGKGLLALANNNNYSFKPYRYQASKLPMRERVALYVEEFLAGVEGRRAYESLPQNINRALREFWGGVRAWLNDNGFVGIADKLGLALGEFTQSDLAYLLKTIRESNADSQGVNRIRFNRIMREESKVKSVKKLYERNPDLFPPSMPKAFADAMLDWNVLSKSPYSDSFYDITNKSWGDDPNSFLRVADHWNFESKGSVHAVTDVAVKENHWTLAAHQKDGGYKVILSLPKVSGDALNKAINKYKQAFVNTQAEKAQIKAEQYLPSILLKDGTAKNSYANALARLNKDTPNARSDIAGRTEHGVRNALDDLVKNGLAI